MIINCTPHPLSIKKVDGSMLVLPKCAVPPRLVTTDKVVDTVDGIAVHETEFGATQGLPEFKCDTFLVVSRMVLDANPDRPDLLAVGAAIRDADGKVVGADGFSC